jgi:anti-sigma factor RsiW
MTAKYANDEFDDELLSAYVDGELTAAERALVEERLRSDPAAAALVEELRTLSSAVKALPRESLGRDLRADVLAEIARARDDLAKHGPTSLPPPPMEPRSGLRRGLLWSALAIAATVLIALFQPVEENREVRNFARSEKRDAEVEKLDRTERRRLAAGEAGETASVDTLSDESLAADADALPPGLRGSITGDKVAGPPVAEESPKAPAAALMAPPEPTAAPTPAEGSADEFYALEKAEQDSLAAASAPEAPSVAMNAKDPTADRRQAGDDVTALHDAPATPTTPLASSSQGETLSGEPMTFGAGGAFAPRGGMLGGGEVAKPAQPPGETSQVVAPPAATVRLKLASPDGALRFEQLLAECEIAPADAAGRKKEKDAADSSRFVRGPALLSRSTAGGSQDAASESDRSLYFFQSKLTPQTASDSAGARIGAELQRSDDSEQPAGQMVWVEATPAQIDALLAKCREDRETFAAVVTGEARASAAKQSEMAEAASESKDSPAPGSPSGATQSADLGVAIRERVLFVLEPATSK